MAHVPTSLETALGVSGRVPRGRRSGDGHESEPLVSPFDVNAVQEQHTKSSVIHAETAVRGVQKLRCMLRPGLSILPLSALHYLAVRLQGTTPLSWLRLVSS